jgi:membrane-associated protein
MDVLASFFSDFNVVDLFLHLDKHLNSVIQQYHTWTYLIVFLVIFCETGLVLTPFLPGDSLLFALGSLAAVEGSSLQLHWLLIVLGSAALLGDTSNYWIGYFVGPKVFHKEKVRLLNRHHLDRAHQFYQKYGGKTVIMARFVPIIRTFAPFVAGIGKMGYLRFLCFSVAGVTLWIGGITCAGYYFGNIPIVKKNFSLVVMAIIVISVMPAIIEFIRARREAKAPQAGK